MNFLIENLQELNSLQVRVFLKIHSQDGQTYAGAVTTNQTPYRANLWGLCDTGAVPTAGSSCRPEKGYNFVPRLVHYVKSSNLANPPSPIRLAAGVQVFGDTDLMQIVPGYNVVDTTTTLVYANSVIISINVN